MLAKRWLCVGIVTLLSLSVAMAAPPAIHPVTGEPLVIDCLRGTPEAIDGDLSDWNLAAMTPAVLDAGGQINTGLASWTGPEDCSGEFYLLWDDVNVYLAVIIKDDALSMNKTDGNIWNADCVEVFFGTTNAVAGHEEHYQYGFNANEQTWLWDDMEGGGQSAVPYLEMAATITEDGYICEVAIPYAEITPLDWSVGSAIGFHPVIDDTEGADREIQMTWTSREAHDQTLGYGHIILSAEAAIAPELSRNPVPANNATDVSPDAVLSWDPGELAVTHDVYFGTVFDDVNDATRNNPLGVLISRNQTALTFDPPDVLEFGQTYYWRVDEVSAAPGSAVYKGMVWNFTIEPFGYPIAGIVATSNTTSAEGQGPDNLVDGSGLNANDQHSTETVDMWNGTPTGEPPYVMFEFDGVYKLHEMLVWNYNFTFEFFLGFGVKSTTIEYSENGTDWTTLGDFELAQGSGSSSYTANSTIAFEGVAAKYVRMNINSSWNANAASHGMSEVRFLAIPVQAREPKPADNAVDVALGTSLSWRAGREATSHEVYLGTDPAALSLAGTPTQSTYKPTSLDLDTTYYWQVVEVNPAEAISAWAGPVWSFSTQEYRVVDNFEGYTDDWEAGEAIWQTWIDGWDDNTNGSQVGYSVSPFAEQTIVHGGNQAMPLFFTNAGAAAISEATRTLAPAQNWAGNGIKSLSLWFYGAADNTGNLYVKVNGTKIPYNGQASDIALEMWQPWNIDLSAAGNVGNVTSLTVGVQGAGSGVVYIDDIRLYAKEPQLIMPVAPDAANLVASYAFNGNLNDGSGHGRNGTMVGAGITFATDPVRGQVLSLPGGSDIYVSIGAVGISGTMPRTIACWAKADNTAIPDWTLIFGFTGTATGEGGNGSHFNIGSLGGPGGVGAHCWGWEETIFSDEDALEWHHYAMSYDGTTISYYGDGVPMDTDPAKSNVQDLSISGDRVHVGSRITQTSSFPGDVDDAVIYNVQLTDGEVAHLAGRTAPRHVPF